MVLELNSCCFCVDLRTGSLIIGYLGLFVNMFVLLFGISGLMLYLSNSNDGNELDPEMAKVSLPTAVFGLMVIFVNLLFLLIFIVGMYMYKPIYVKTYIIYYGISIFLSIIMFMHNMILKTSILGAFSELFSILLNIYFLLVIRSYYLVMGTERPRPQMYIPNPQYGQGHQPYPNAPPYNMNAPRMPPPPMGGHQPYPNAPPYNMNAPRMPPPPMGESTNTSRPPSPTT